MWCAGEQDEPLQRLKPMDAIPSITLPGLSANVAPYDSSEDSRMEFA